MVKNNNNNGVEKMSNAKNSNKKVVTYAAAYDRDMMIDVCDDCYDGGKEKVEQQIGAVLGPVQHGLHRGVCECCGY